MGDERESIRGGGSPGRDISFAQIKTGLTIDEAWRRFRLPGAPSRVCRSPFRQDEHASFSIWDGGRRFKDFATGDRGDVVDFVRLALNGTTPEALVWCREQLGGGDLRAPGRRAHVRTPVPKTEKRKPNRRRLSAELREVWDEGVTWLEFDSAMQWEIEQWRNWPSGTVWTLARRGLMGAPNWRGRGRVLGFPVQAPLRSGLSLCGFHVRHEPKRTDARPSWEFVPRGTTGWPFVLNGFLGGVQVARLVVVAEGQWDLITFFAAAGWLRDEGSLPPGVAGVAFRGASSWRTTIEAWGRYWSRRASVLVLPDNDPAGAAWWSGSGEFVRELAGFSRRVCVLPIADGAGGKDFNELHRRRPFSPADIRELLVKADILEPGGRLK